MKTVQEEAAIAVRVTDDQELIDVYDFGKRRNPVMLDWYLQSLGIEDDPADILAKKDRIYWMRFDPTPFDTASGARLTERG